MLSRKAPHSRQNKPDCFAASLNQSFFALILTRRNRPVGRSIRLSWKLGSMSESPHFAGEDPDSLIRKSGAKRFREIVAHASGFDYALARSAQEGALDSPSGKSATARRLGPLIAIMRDPVLREATTSRICARLGISETHSPPTSNPQSRQPQRLRQNLPKQRPCHW